MPESQSASSMVGFLKTDSESESADDTELQIDKNETEEDNVLLAPQSAGSLGYSDMPETSGWRYEAVAYVKEKGIMNGFPVLPDSRRTSR